MPWVVSARGRAWNTFACFRCRAVSNYKCYTDKCTLTPSVHRYCQRCYYFYSKRADDDCPGCAPRVWLEEKANSGGDQASPPPV